MKIMFVLVEPAVAENIGAAARAIKTMGFQILRLVNPVDHLSGPARWLAHGSNDILENAKIFTSLKDAIADADFTIASSAKQRIVKNDYHPLESLPGIIEAKGAAIKKVAIVFGREDSGLRNKELKLCDLVSTIPLPAPFPSLNLAQAVMVYAYELAKLNRLQKSETKRKNTEGLIPLKQKASDILLQIGFKENSAIYPRIMERLMLLNEDDIHILHSVCNKFKKIEK